MRRVTAFTLALLAAGCAKCGSPKTTAAPAAMVRSIDFRSVALALFPEYRGTDIVETDATLKRTHSGVASDWKRTVESALVARGFSVDAGEGNAALWASSNRFSISAKATDQTTELRVHIALSPDEVPKLYQNVLGLGSEQMGTYLPPLGLPVAREEFIFSLKYRASPSRADFLVRQMVDANVLSGWKRQGSPDAGYESVRLVDESQGARIEVDVAEDAVNLVYRLTTQ